MVIRIRQGKGGKDREVPLSPKPLDQLRTYYRSLKHKSGWLFPSIQTRRRDEPMTDKAIWHACREATRRAGITKPVHPHTLRHKLRYSSVGQRGRVTGDSDSAGTQRLAGHDDLPAPVDPKAAGCPESAG
jgi:integrase